MKRYYARYWWVEPCWCDHLRPWVVIRRDELVRNAAGGSAVSRHETRKAARAAARALNEKEQAHGQS